MDFTMNDTLTIVTLKLKATDKGHLYPQIHDLKVNYTGTDMHYDGFILSRILYREVFRITKYVSMAAMNRFGARIYNHMLPEWTRRLTNSQHYHFSLDYPQLEKHGDFNINYALTRNPHIHNKVMDLDFFFDVGAGNDICHLKGDEHDYLFQNFNEKYMQFVLSDRVINCFLAAMEGQDMFHFVINTQWIRNRLGSGAIKITSQYVYNEYPQIGQKYGMDQELDLEVKMRAPTIRFAPESGNNIHFQFDLLYGIKLKDDMNYLVYDEMRFSTEFDMEISEEVLLMNFKSMQMVPWGSEHETRQKPVFTDIEISAEEYDDFWDYTDLRMQKWLDFFNNEVFDSGVPLPYWKLSFLTALTFHPHAMIMIVELFYNK